MPWACGFSCRPVFGPEPSWARTDEAGFRRPSAPDGQDGHGAAAVVRDEDVAARLVHDEVARPRPFRRLLVEERQIAGLRVDREGADRARLRPLEARDLPHRVEETAVRVEGEESGILHLGRENGLGRRAGGGVEGEAVDPAARAVGVGADVDGDGAGLGGRRGDGGGGNRGESDQEGGASEGSERVGHGRDPAPPEAARQRQPRAHRRRRPRGRPPRGSRGEGGEVDRLAEEADERGHVRFRSIRRGR